MANMFIMYLITKQYMTKIVKKLVVSNPLQSFIINVPNKVLFCGVTKIKKPARKRSRLFILTS